MALSMRRSPCSTTASSLHIHRAGSLFEQLDTDRTGYVSLDEFYFAFRHLADFSAVKDRHLLVRASASAMVACVFASV